MARHAFLQPAKAAPSFRALLAEQRGREAPMDLDTPPLSDPRMMTRADEHPPRASTSALGNSMTAQRRLNSIPVIAGPEVEMAEATPPKVHRPTPQYTATAAKKVRSSNPGRRNGNSQGRMSYGRGSAAFDARDDENERDWVYEAGSADEEEEEEDDSSFEGPRAGSSMSSSALARLAITPTSKSRRRPASLKSPNSRITHHHWYQPAAATPPKTESSSSAWADPAVAKAWGAALANGGVTACGLYVLFHMVSAFASDVRSKAKAHERIHHSEIARCAQQYSLNHCGTPNQAPVLAEQCAAWEACYARDPSTVSSTYKLVAEVFADVVKGFLGPLGYKEMIFVAVMGYLLTTLVVRCTLAFLGQAKLMVQQQASPQAFQPGHSHPRSIAASSFMPPFGVHPSMAQIDHQSARSRPWASQSTAEAQHPRERRVVERSS